MTLLRVVLADDHTILRAGIRALLERIDGVTVVAEAADAREALELVEQYDPDVLITDISMEGMSGLEAARRVRATHPSVKIIVLSMYGDEQSVREALHAGATAYLLKGAAIVELELALQAAAADQTYLSPAVSRHVIDGYLKGTGGDSLRDVLTPRQREILRLLAEGRSTKEIAHDLQISVKTVETHRAQIMERLEIHDVPSLVRYAMRIGLIPPER